MHNLKSRPVVDVRNRVQERARTCQERAHGTEISDPVPRSALRNTERSPLDLQVVLLLYSKDDNLSGF